MGAPGGSDPPGRRRAVDPCHGWMIGVVATRRDGRVLILCATKKLLDRIGPPAMPEGERSTTRLGQWYATALSWRPQVALLVNEPTLLPVLMPLAPPATLPRRAAGQIAAGLAAPPAPGPLLRAGVRPMRDHP